LSARLRHTGFLLRPCRLKPHVRARIVCRQGAPGRCHCGALWYLRCACCLEKHVVVRGEVTICCSRIIAT
ncbi:unnamed protein product, partial [Ectocarpus fasciculatus]